MSFTTYLFPKPDAAYSAGQVLDLFATPQQYNRSETTEQADIDAFKRDWAAIGEDLRNVLLEFAQNLG
jgi:hypothetical protein